MTSKRRLKAVVHRRPVQLLDVNWWSDTVFIWCHVEGPLSRVALLFVDRLKEVGRSVLFSSQHALYVAFELFDFVFCLFYGELLSL
mgnify:CR=1 FL=1